MRYPVACAAAISALVLVPPPADAQITLPEVRPTEDDRPAVEVADSLFDALEPGRSWDRLQSFLATRPDDYEANWRAARAALVLGVLETDPDGELGWLERATRHADRALATDSAGIDALYWSASAKGRLALQHGPRASVDLAQQMWDITHEILARDPTHAGAHNILGKLNHEVMRLSGWQRMLGKLVLGSDPLRDSSWEKARHHHETAVASDSTTVLFLMDLAQTYEHSGDEERAVEYYRRALELPDRYPVDPEFKRRIREWLSRIT